MSPPTEIPANNFAEIGFTPMVKAQRSLKGIRAVQSCVVFAAWVKA